MLKILMLRHGMTEGNSKGRYIGVTNEPILEEEKGLLRGMYFGKPDAVYCSPLKRCIETAQLLFPENRIFKVPEFRECDFGRFEGKTYQELLDEPVYQQWLESGVILSFPEGESKRGFQERCLEGFETVVETAGRMNQQFIAMIVHGGTIASVLDEYGFPEKGYYDWFVKNLEGYKVRLSIPDFSKGDRKLIVGEKITRKLYSKER